MTRKSKKPIETLILTIRGQKVILDADLAELYGVPTKVFNQALKRNQERFPDDFAFQLTAEEFAALRAPNSSQIAISSRPPAGNEAGTPNWSQFVTSSRKLRPLLAPPPEPPREEIGFHVKEDAAPYRVRPRRP